MADDDFTRAGMAILRDLALFNQANVFFEEHVDPAVRTAVGELVKGWVDRKSWEADWDASDSLADIALWPVAWKGEEEQPYASFRLDYRDEAATNSYQVADMFGAGQTDFGFRFLPEHSWFGGKSAWNAFAKTIGAQVEPLARAGWLYEGKGIFFRPVPLSAKALANAWENGDWTEALAPLATAMDGLDVDQKLFDGILVQAKRKTAGS